MISFKIEHWLSENCLAILSSVEKTYKSMRSSTSISQTFYMNFKYIFGRNPIDVYFSNVFRSWLKTKGSILFFLCYKSLLQLKMPFPTFVVLIMLKKGKFCLKSGGKKMFCSYHNVHVLPIRNFRQWGKKWTMVGLYSTYKWYLPHFVR